MNPCPHCGHPVPDGSTVCPNCGTPLPSAGGPVPVCPPPPGRSASPPPPTEPRLLTKSAGGDIALGVVITLVSLFIGGLGFIVMPILYFVLRPTQPTFARGIGYGVLTSLVLLLGAFALCFYGISHEPS